MCRNGFKICCTGPALTITRRYLCQRPINDCCSVTWKRTSLSSLPFILLPSPSFKIRPLWLLYFRCIEKVIIYQLSSFITIKNHYLNFIFSTYAFYFVLKIMLCINILKYRRVHFNINSI